MANPTNAPTECLLLGGNGRPSWLVTVERVDGFLALVRFQCGTENVVRARLDLDKVWFIDQAPETTADERALIVGMIRGRQTQ